MNKILREEMEYLINCNDKAITPDVKDDVSLTLQYIDELETRIDKAIEYIENLSNEPNVFGHYGIDGNCKKYLLDILRGEYDEN